MRKEKFPLIATLLTQLKFKTKSESDPDLPQSQNMCTSSSISQAKCSGDLEKAPSNEKIKTDINNRIGNNYKKKE